LQIRCDRHCVPVAAVFTQQRDVGLQVLPHDFVEGGLLGMTAAP